MAKYKVKRKFKDIVTKQTHDNGDEIDVTVKRADEINKKLKKYGDVLERINETPEE